jgi:XisI protein
MDKIISYKKIARNLILEIAAMTTDEPNGAETQIITDDEHGHYILFGVGWEKEKWFYATFLHIDVKPNGKIWIQHNGTSLQIGTMLEERGIAKNEIVFGYKSPATRELMDGYAVG